MMKCCFKHGPTAHIKENSGAAEEHKQTKTLHFIFNPFILKTKQIVLKYFQLFQMFPLYLICTQVIKELQMFQYYAKKVLKVVSKLELLQKKRKDIYQKTQIYNQVL